MLDLSYRRPGPDAFDRPPRWLAWTMALTALVTLAGALASFGLTARAKAEVAEIER
jgi:hypothetical protein